MTGALFEDCCQRHLERSGIRGKKMLWEAKRFVLGRYYDTVMEYVVSTQHLS